jgi:hypothetical protein
MAAVLLIVSLRDLYWNRLRPFWVLPTLGRIFHTWPENRGNGLEGG